MPRLSIIIPLLGDPRKLDDTLVSVLENRPAHCEVLVVHNRPYDDPYQLSDEVCFIEARLGAGIVECLNAGISASSSPIVHILTCGVEVCSGWADAALRRFCDADVAAVAAVVLRRDDCRQVVSVGMSYRAEGTSWHVGQGQDAADAAVWASDLRGPDLLAAFYRKSDVEAVGGFADWATDSIAATDMALMLQQTGFHCVLEPQCRAHVLPATTAVRPSLAYGRDAERLFWRWASTGGWMRSLVGHAAMLVGQCVVSLLRPTMIAQIAGRCLGTLQALFQRRRALPKPTEQNEPSMVPGPHLAVGTERTRPRKSARVA